MSNENKFPLKKNDTGRAKGAPSEDHTTPPSSRTASGGILSYLISACGGAPAGDPPVSVFFAPNSARAQKSERVTALRDSNAHKQRLLERFRHAQHAYVVLWLRAGLHHAMPRHPCVPKQTTGAGAYRPEAGRRALRPRQAACARGAAYCTSCTVLAARPALGCGGD
jgi:hypothetical protein